MLRPSYGVTNRRSLLRARRIREKFSASQKHILRHSAASLDHFRGIARKMPLQNLEHTPRMFESRISPRQRRVAHLASAVFSMPAGGLLMCLSITAGFLRSLFLPAVEPRSRIILFLLVVPSREESVQVLCILEVLAQYCRRIGVRDDILSELFLVLEDVIDDPAEKCDVTSCAQRHPDVRHR